ncbi:MAG: Asp-tRNA(Asn)/Glu-tRNA(Gln) amidotransferase subunit GatB [Planctomycetota bacterium]|nr:Asp-tRNA(Asn)/Glu-tRNA(Gln) amidotransferase subunit GatB [Planctomycetota bacterium]
MSAARWEPVIGLEVHCQLATRTKLFCGCKNEFGAPPNTNTCPVCSGQPGALPVLNEEALALALRAAVALGCEVAPRSKFDRKNYFYCDLPKGYQVSQYDEPFCSGGGLLLSSGTFVRLTRIHLEEDAGKSIHDRGDTTLVDLNRAGIPLIESVTEADIRSSEEAHEYLTALKEILEYAGVSNCDMEKGSLRCDVNVSVHRPDEPFGTRVELKNLNSFRHVREAIEHEIARQVEACESGDPERFPVQETRLYDPGTGSTRVMRSKEDAHDYRYFPEPDLPPLVVDDALLERARAAVPELPRRRRERFVLELGLSEYDAGVLTGSRAIADFFEETAGLCGDAKQAANWVANDVLGALGDDEVPGSRLEELTITPTALAELVALVAAGTVHRKAARQVLRGMLVSGKDAPTLVAELGLEQVSDRAELEGWVREALAGRDRVIADVKAGKVKALGAIVGAVMKASGGRADPKAVQEIALRIVGEEL